MASSSGGARPTCGGDGSGAWGARVLNCWTFGTVLLMAWNLLPLPHVGINPISSLLTGALGISGLPLTVFLNMMP